MKKMVCKFDVESTDLVRICNNHIVILSGYTVVVHNQRGEVLKEIRYLENEGKPKLLESNGE